MQALREQLPTWAPLDEKAELHETMFDLRRARRVRDRERARAISETEQAVAAELIARGVADRVTVSSDHRSVLATTRELAPDAGTTWIVWFRDWRWWMWYVACRVRRLKADCVAPPGERVTEAMLEYFHDRGITVRAWGVGRDEDLAGRLIAMGVDGMTFDDPRRLSELLGVEGASGKGDTA